MTETEQQPQEHTHENCENHDHDHEDAQPNINKEELLSKMQQSQQALSHKNKKEEKKFVKIMKKQKLKQLEGITRVTLRTSKNLVMYIDNPVIMMSGNDQSYVIFGEPQYLDFNKNLADNVKPLIQGEDAEKGEELKDIQEEDQDDDEDVDQGDIKEEDIQTLIDYSKCSRGKAIKALKSTNGDVVEAITKLS